VVFLTLTQSQGDGLMSETIGFANSLGIRKSGKDEFWLQDQICDNPTCLGLGELVVVDRERTQSSGGRLDILLKNPDDDAMYEVEIMLGKTDESHIIRTIEYWDNERRRWPQRQHRAVLVAEEITNRFFNVIHLLSKNIPIIAIQVSLVEVHGHLAMSFTKVLDVYEEEEDDGQTGGEIETTRGDWERKSIWTVETADCLKELISGARVFEEPCLRYKVYYIAIASSNTNYFFLNKRSGGKTSSLYFRVKEEKRDELREFLEKAGIPCKLPGRRDVRISIDKQFVEQHKEAFIKIAEYVKDFKEQ